ncbi:hypothetical protein XELAEV_18004748mg [Xenopus laevis]|uniref:Ig-like domain-containing protein n=1 Tax=Xenopus laevis TaxID=8355 RepID=A0A974DVL0_XENLA|nr:hypothetical protein XELAEV_18004748mg [Xenopus laevis]
MSYPTYLLLLLGILLIFSQASYGQIVLTQSPDYVSVSPGETVTLTCKAGSSVTDSEGDNWIACTNTRRGLAHKD